jgi:hypothetical protein
MSQYTLPTKIELLAENGRLRAERDELLAALKDVAEYRLPKLLHKRVTAAIAKAEGGK